MTMNNINGKINNTVLENARRQIAKECLIELRSHGIPDDKLTTQILDKYIPKFKPLNKTKFNTKDVMGHYIRKLQKEEKNGN